MTRWHRRLGELATRCWCEKNIVWVPAADVRAGLTLPCRWQACKDLDTVARARREP